MQIFRKLLVVAIAVAPLAFAIPAEAVDNDSGAPTYTCDIVYPAGGGTTGVLGDTNCAASNGAPNTPGIPITIGRPFLITARMGLKQTFRCTGGTPNDPGGNADLPTTVTGNYCHLV
jgi:hypothetical protein